MAGMKRAKSGFMTRSEAQVMATLSSIADHVSAKVPDSVLCYCSLVDFFMPCGVQNGSKEGIYLLVTCPRCAK